MKLNKILIAGLIASSLTMMANNSKGDDKKPMKGEKKLEKQTKKPVKKKAIKLTVKKLNVCEACGRG